MTSVSQQRIDDPVHPFDPQNPKLGKPVVEERLYEILKTKAGALSSTNVLVQDIPFVDQKPVISYLTPLGQSGHRRRGQRVLSWKTSCCSCVIRPLTLKFSDVYACEGCCDRRHNAFVLGATFLRSYFCADDHLIDDARHGGALIHDESLKVEGPAVEHID